MQYAKERKTSSGFYAVTRILAMSALQLRQYQSESIEHLRNGFIQKHKRQILAASTGSGKSLIALHLIQQVVDKGKRVLFVCDRRILIEQFSKHLDSYGIDHSVIMAGDWRDRPPAQENVASIQTLERMDSWPAVDLIIIDEIHAVMRQSLKKFLTNNPNLNVVGLTATPYQKDLPDYFTSVTNVVTMDELVDDGFLVNFRIFGATEIDTKGVKVSMGEWQKDELEKRGLKVVGDVVADYIKIYTEVWGTPKPSIVFSSGISHGTELVRKFAEHGLNFVQLSYKDTDEYKYEVLQEFAKPDTDILGLVSSEILVKGFDSPKVEHVILARPIRKSFSMFVQMIGRGARPYPDKKFAIIQDNAGNWLRFKDDWDELYHNGVKTLESDADKKTRKEPTEKEKTASKCPRCRQIWPTLKTDICPTCGFKRERKSTVEAVAGEMVELTGANKEKYTKEVKQEWYSQLLGYAKAKGYKEGYAYYAFKDKFNIFPHHSLEKIPVPMTPEVRNFITHLAIKKSKQNR